ncbi:TRAP transporter small permease [Thermodesulfobacteriota bacterium]
MSGPIISSIKSATELLEKYTASFSHLLGVFSAIGLIAMMIITVVDATGRRFFSFTIYGGYEGVSFILCGVFFFSLCYTTAKRGHFSIDVMMFLLPPRVRLYIITIMNLVSVIMCWILASQLVVLSMKLKANNLTGAQLTFVPIYILALVGAFCLLMTGWGFFVQFINVMVRAIEGNESPPKGQSAE